MFTKDTVLVDGLVLIRFMEPSSIAEMNAQIVLTCNILRIIPKPVHATQCALMIINITITMHIVLLEKVIFESSQRNLLCRD